MATGVKQKGGVAQFDGTGIRKTKPSELIGEDHRRKPIKLPFACRWIGRSMGAIEQGTGGHGSGAHGGRRRLAAPVESAIWREAARKRRSLGPGHCCQNLRRKPRVIFYVRTTAMERIGPNSPIWPPVYSVVHG